MGGSGDDILIGGGGLDVLDGGSCNNILINSLMAHSATADAVSQLMKSAFATTADTHAPPRLTTRLRGPENRGSGPVQCCEDQP